ncbi:serine protease [Salinisphaera dokdonensis CL-ES53]|uniref:Serine protease n=1 Tax=Salinisphaera dokdonensis CL-ES53 TaxID=1304272 RepID=A0ABV2AX01_9GAMM
MTDRRLGRRLHFLTVPVVAAAIAATSFSAQAADIVLVVGDSSNSGFNDPTPVEPVGGNGGNTLGAQRRIAFRYAAAILGSRVQSTVPIRIEAAFDSTFACGRNSATLASASPVTFVANFTSQSPREANIFYPLALANALRGRRVSNTVNDVTARFNPGLDSNADCLGGEGWYYGIDGATPDDQPSFVSTVGHELTHGLGFVSLVAVASGDGNQPGQFPRSPSGTRYPDIYSSFIQDLEVSGQPFWPDLTDEQRRESLTNTPNVVFAGDSTNANGAPALTQGTNQGRVKIYTPAALSRSSSIAHWDPSLGPDQIMEPFATGGDTVTRGIGLSSCVLQDIGWPLANGTRCPDDSNEAIQGDMTADDVEVEQPVEMVAGGQSASRDDDDGGSGGGGCTIADNARFDPLWMLLLVAAAGAVLRRRRTA